MNDDKLLLLSSFILYWVTFVFLIIKTKNKNDKKKVSIINLSIHLVYSVYYLYCLFYKSEGGSALVWWFLLLLILGIHWIINLGQIIYLIFKSKKKIIK